MEDNKVPIFDLSEMDKMDNGKVESQDIHVTEKISEPVTHEGLLDEKEKIYNLDESTKQDIVNRLKIMVYNDESIFEKDIEKTMNDKNAVRDIIEFRSKNTLINLFSDNNIDQDELYRDIKQIKEYQRKGFNFNDLDIHLNYDSNSKEEVVNLSELVDLYKEEILSKKGTDYRIYIDGKEIDPIYELNSIKFQYNLSNEINEMIDDSNTVDKEEEKIERL